jgi:hypothetical protein
MAASPVKEVGRSAMGLATGGDVAGGRLGWGVRLGRWRTGRGGGVGGGRGQGADGWGRGEGGRRLGEGAGTTN